MSGYPELRKVTASILTPLGWAHGTFHLPPMQTLLDFLNAGHPIIKCTRVRLPGTPQPINFVGFRRESLIVVAPTMNELVEPEGSIGRTTTREVSVLLDAGVLRAQLEVLVNLRVSDYLRQQTGLVVLRNGAMSGHADAEGTPPRKMPIAIVNLARAVGVAQAESAPVN